MAFLNLFKNSAKELKSIRCICLTGIFIAIYVVMNSPLMSVNTEVLKITFGYIALAAIGMLYGPVVAVIAAIPCDIVAALVGSLGIDFIFTVPKILEGLIYGIFLYGYSARGSGNPSPNAGTFNLGCHAAWRVMRIVLARLLAVFLCYLLLNSSLLYYYMKLSSDTFAAFMFPRYMKTMIQLPVDLALMLTVLPLLRAIYNKTKLRYGKERRVKT